MVHSNIETPIVENGQPKTRLNFPKEPQRPQQFQHQQSGVVVYQQRDFISRSQIHSAASSRQSQRSSAQSSRSLPTPCSHFHAPPLYRVKECTRMPRLHNKVVASLRDVMKDKKALGQRFNRFPEDKLPEVRQQLGFTMKNSNRLHPELALPVRAETAPAGGSNSFRKSGEVNGVVTGGGSDGSKMLTRNASMKTPVFKGFQSPRTAEFLAMEEEQWRLAQQTSLGAELPGSPFSTIHTYRWKLDEELGDWLKDVKNRNSYMLRQQEKAEAKWDKRIHMRVFRQREKDVRRRQQHEQLKLLRKEVEKNFIQAAAQDERREENEKTTRSSAFFSESGSFPGEEEKVVESVEEVDYDEAYIPPLFGDEQKEVPQKKELQWKSAEEVKLMNKEVEPRITQQDVWVGPGRFVTQHHMAK